MRRSAARAAATIKPSEAQRDAAHHHNHGAAAGERRQRGGAPELLTDRDRAEDAVLGVKKHDIEAGVVHSLVPVGGPHGGREAAVR